MTVKELREFLRDMPAEWQVNVALPENRIERVDRIGLDPFADDEELLIWPGNRTGRDCYPIPEEPR
jgi:hypothetical protein